MLASTVVRSYGLVMRTRAIQYAALFALVGACSKPSAKTVDAARGVDGPSQMGSNDARRADGPVDFGTVRFIALGDFGDASVEQYAVAAGMEAVCATEGCDFVVTLGDNIYGSGIMGVDDPQWQTKFELPYANLNLPFHGAMGNHDYGGYWGERPFGFEDEGAGNEWEKGQYFVDYTNHSSKWRMPSTFYTLEEGPVGFIVLDTNSIAWGKTTYGDQVAWLPGARAAIAERPWKIIVGHHPMRSNGEHGNAGEYDAVEFEGIDLPIVIPVASGVEVKNFMTTHACGIADVYLSGHDHAMQWINEPDALCGTELVVSGAGSGTEDFVDRGNAVRFQDFAHSGFLHVTANATTWRGRFYDASGMLLFEHTLQK